MWFYHGKFLFREDVGKIYKYENNLVSSSGFHIIITRILDDPTFATLNSLIFFNNVEIVGQIQGDDKFLEEL